jgi:enterochelin esterase family protein
MKRFALLAMLSFAAPAPAQSLVSPEVHPDGRVTFRLNAPNARAVELRCEGVPRGTMQRDDQGIWSITTEPLAPDIYVYSFLADGLRVLDPGNPVLKYNLFSTENQVHVPGPATLPWEINDVPHGAVHRHHYKSAIIGAERPFLVYTPPGYDPASPQRYPVLYLLHGYSDAEDTWTTVGRADVILDNLIARGLATPMLVVMPLGYGNAEVLAGGWARVRSPGFQAISADSHAKFRDALLREVIPQIEKAYRVSPDPAARAIAGLSMGGTQSLFIGLNAPDRFAWVGAFGSGGLNADFAAAYPSVGPATNAPLRLLWLACGEQDGLLGVNQKLEAWLTAKGVRHSWTQIPGAHSFRTWRPLLVQFTSLLFRAAP